MKKRRGQRSVGRKGWGKEKRSLKKGKKKTKMEVKKKEGWDKEKKEGREEGRGVSG